MSRPGAVPFVEALRFWLKLGFISFGGPAGQIAVMHRELVEQRRWISERRFLHALNYCMLLPGPEAQQLATYLGWLMHRTRGGVIAGVLFVLPSLLLLIALSWIYLVFGQVPWVAGVFYGIKPAVAAIVLHAVWRIGSKTLRSPRRSPWLWAMAIASFVAIAVLGIGFPWVVLAALCLGWLGGWLAPGQFLPAPTHAAPAEQGQHLAALIDDDTPTPVHARFSRARLVRVVLAGLVLWALPMAVLVVWQGWGGPLPTMGMFFTQAALLTFGGAYAVLPFVYQGAVVQHAWLSGPQMIDGLALGETTPGPLIMVVAFVAFLGGWQTQVLGAQSPWLGGLVASVVVTWFTFLPSFVFILAGGPLVESTHGQLRFTAPLTGITAAVVGVVASLGVFFLGHVARPVAGGPLDGIALFIGAMAALALLRFKLGVMTVIGACAVLGVLLKTSGWAV
ncbi:MAG: chromate efflux transporter [Hydrogenophaga sp.]|uniref:chromate efflux transporter n=1 Tax=Hydrogenophaga sp. TaxID=1904254 RepID=UPI001DC4AC99|nr:chromate efflux transporter [Hydrogenophaga sp.]MBX3610662.1 chromate efflux transporter [Hydrogenophaga sp.]